MTTISERKEPKFMLGVTVDYELVKKLDAMRGLASRSRLVEKILTDVVTAVEKGEGREKHKNETNK